MKTFKLTILFAFFISIGHSQNLVPDPSFEDTLYCPYSNSQVNSLVNWFTAANTPDYFNSCCSSPSCSVPGNFAGYQLPVTGNGYVGMYAYANFHYREFIGVHLTSPLIVNSTYYISFMAVRSVITLATDCACNNLGVIFSNNHYDGIFTNTVPMGNPHVHSTQVLVDTLNWTSLNFTFTADSNYNYMYIGNFLGNNLTTIQQFGSQCAAYYFIDGVYASLDSLTSINSQIDQVEFSVFPNPTQDIITVQNSQHRSLQIEIYNYLDELLKKFDATKDEKIILDISDLSQGLYFINLKSDNNVNIVRKIIKL